MDKVKFIEDAFASASRALDRASAVEGLSPEDFARIAQCWAHLAGTVAEYVR